jgi:hypothetical protein
MGRSVIDEDHGTRRGAEVARRARSRPRAIAVAVVAIVLIAVLVMFMIGVIAHFLGSSWLAQQLEDLRWFVNEMKIWRLQLHP